MGELNQVSSYLPYLVPVILIELGLAAAAFIDVLKRPDTRLLPRPWWILIILCIGILGPVVYFVAGREE